MIDVVGIIEATAEAADYHFVYGGNENFNSEIKRIGSLKDQTPVVALSPVAETGVVESGTVDRYRAEFIVILARKYEEETVSSVAETYKQKYDRRLKDLKSLLELFVSSFSCGGYMELESVYYDNVINRFSTSMDGTQVRVTTLYSADASSGDFVITPPLPDIIEWNNVIGKPIIFSGDYDDLENQPDLFSGSYKDLTDKPTIPALPSRIGFSARKSSTSMLAKDYTKVEFDIEVEDTCDCWDGGTFTAPSDGMYEVLGHATFTKINAGNIAIVGVSVNSTNDTHDALALGLEDGGLLGRGTSATSTLGGYGGAMNLLLNEGDTVKLVVYCENATTLFASSSAYEGYTTFSIYKKLF